MGQYLKQIIWSHGILSKDQITMASLDAIAPIAILLKVVKEVYDVTEREDIIDVLYNESLEIRDLNVMKRKAFEAKFM